MNIKKRTINAEKNFNEILNAEKNFNEILKQGILDQFDFDKALEASKLLGYKNPILQEVTKDSLKNSLTTALKDYKHDMKDIEHGPFKIIRVHSDRIRVLFRPAMIEDYDIKT